MGAHGLFGSVAGQPIRRFRPTDIPGCTLWLKADQITGLSDADAVSTWEDQSAEGNDASEAGANRPIYKTGIVNGLPVVRFNGSSQWLNLDSLISGIKTAATVFAVAAHDSVASAYRGIIGSGTSATSPYQFIGLRAENGGFVFQNRTDAPATIEVVGNVDITDGSWYLYTGQKTASNNITRAGINGGTYGTNASTGTLNGLTNTIVGAVYYNSGPLSFWDGDIAEIIIYNTELSANNRGLVETYANNKYLLY